MGTFAALTTETCTQTHIQMHIHRHRLHNSFAKVVVSEDFSRQSGSMNSPSFTESLEYDYDDQWLTDQEAGEEEKEEEKRRSGMCCEERTGHRLTILSVKLIWSVTCFSAQLLEFLNQVAHEWAGEQSFNTRLHPHLDKIYDHTKRVIKSPD